MKTPDFGYHPRTADDRVGHFLSATKDFGVTDPDSNFVRLINRWRLEKANPRAKLSPPKKQIVWYVEDTVPIEYRPYVEEGIREWNKAFEKIGFKDAIAVRWEESGRDDFDPEDTNYCTFRWVTTDMRLCDVVPAGQPAHRRDDRRRRRLRRRLHPLLEAAVRPLDRQHDGPRRPAADRPAGHRRGDQPDPGLEDGLRPARRRASARHRRARQEPRPDDPRGRPRRSELPVVAAGQEPRARDAGASASSSPASSATSAWPRSPWPTTNDAAKPAADKTDKDKDKDKDKADKKKPEPKDELPEEFIGQAIKDIVMHEVGHSLGLRHNFKASTMLTADQLNDTAITHVKGLVGSVMDYSPINIAPKGKKQGDYYTTTIGPYDYWAIEYAYKPIDGRRGSRAQEDRRASPGARPGLRDRRRLVLERRPLRQSLGPGFRPVPVRQGADRAGDRALERPGCPRGQGRRIVGADPPRLQHLARAVGRRRDAGLAVHRRPVGLARSQGRQGRTRPDRARRRGQAARVPEVPHRLDPQRQVVPVLTGLAPPAGNRALDALGHRTASSGPASISRCSSGSSESRRSCWATA